MEKKPSEHEKAHITADENCVSVILSWRFAWNMDKTVVNTFTKIWALNKVSVERVALNERAWFYVIEIKPVWSTAAYIYVHAKPSQTIPYHTIPSQAKPNTKR